MANIKNITNGQIDLDVEEDDRVNENYKFVRVPGGDMFDAVRRKNPNQLTNYYIENIRTGSFSQISETYMLQSHKVNEENQRTEDLTTDSFDTEMIVLKQTLQGKLQKSITFFQGIYAGMALLFAITLNLSQSISRDLVRVEDQSIRIISLLSALGALFSAVNARQKYNFIKIRGTSAEVDLRYKCLILCIIEMVCKIYYLSYFFYNVTHSYSVSFNINGTEYSRLSSLTTVYTVIAVLAWVITNINTYKYDI